MYVLCRHINFFISITKNSCKTLFITMHSIEKKKENEGSVNVYVYSSGKAYLKM